MNEPSPYIGHSVRITPEVFGRFALIMAKFGLNQAKFAARIDIKSPGFISDMKKGRSNMSVATLERICEAFSVNKNWVLEGKGPSGLGEVVDETATPKKTADKHCIETIIAEVLDLKREVRELKAMIIMMSQAGR